MDLDYSDFMNLIMTIIALKSLIWGSDYSFKLKLKYGDKYSEWYKNRPKFFIQENTKKEEDIK